MRITRLVCPIVCAAVLTFAGTSPALARDTSRVPLAGKTAVARVHAVEATGPDAFENDNAQGDATAVALGARTAVHNLYPNAGQTSDEDWFSFTAVAGHTYDISTRFEGASIDSFDSIPLELDDAAAYPLRVALYTDWWADDGMAARICWTADESGTYYVATWDQDDAFATDHHAVEYSLLATDLGVVTPGTVARVGGADRYEVAASLARNTQGTYAGVTRVIIASGLDNAMADALSASGLAGTIGGPVLLVRADRGYLPAPTKTAIQACVAANPGAKMEFHIVGGPASVPVGLEKQLRLAAPGATIERISGADRYAVAANVAAHMRAHGASGSIAFIVNGQNPTYFSDALAASPEAAFLQAPILLVKSKVIPPATATALKSYKNRCVVGIPDKAVYQVAYEALDATTPDTGSLTWIDGYSRDGIARHFAEFWEGGVTPAYRYTVANKLSDALTAGSAPSLGYGFVLYADATVSAGGLVPLGTDTFVQLRRAHAPAVTVVGGPASVGPDVEQRLSDLVGN